MKIAIKKTHPDAILPTRANPGDSGLDLYALLPDGQLVLGPGEWKLIRTGIAIELPEAGYEAQVRPRSGLAARAGVQACFGTIDSGYRGEVHVNLFNFSYVAWKIDSGRRIAQLVIAPVVYAEVFEVDELSETERGLACFGSTDV